jgi:uncharacterized protein YraI
MRIRQMMRAITLAGALVLGLTLPTLSEAVTANGFVNIRSGPDTSYPVIRVAVPGRFMAVRGCSRNWCSIRYGLTHGYISAHNITR